MICAHCGNLPTYVKKTLRPSLNESVVRCKRRERQCMHCKGKFTTFEVSEAEFKKLQALTEDASLARRPLRAVEKKENGGSQ